MRVYELTTRINGISRSPTADNPRGRLSTNAAAYRAGARIHCNRSGQTFDYTRKGGVHTSRIFTPNGGPLWLLNRSALWNAVEWADDHARYAQPKKAQPATEIMFGFATELSETGRRVVMEKVAAFLLAKGVAAVDANIHAPGREGDERNWHVHMMIPTRSFDGAAFGKKLPWQTNIKKAKSWAKEIRAYIAQAQNEQLAAEGKSGEVQVEHRSFKARGDPRTPQKHEGPAITNSRRRSQSKQREDWRAETANLQKQRHLDERKALRERQNADWRRFSAQLERRAAERIREEVARLRAERRADIRPAGLKALYHRLTGQSTKLEAARQERVDARLVGLRRSMEEVRRAREEARETHRAEQKAEREALTARQEREGGQMRSAFEARASRDRVSEQLGRQPANDPGMERQRDHPGRTLER